MAEWNHLTELHAAKAHLTAALARLRDAVADTEPRTPANTNNRETKSKRVKRDDAGPM